MYHNDSFLSHPIVDDDLRCPSVTSSSCPSDYFCDDHGVSQTRIARSGSWDEARKHLAKAVARKRLREDPSPKNDSAPKTKKKKRSKTAAERVKYNRMDRQRRLRIKSMYEELGSLTNCDKKATKNEILSQVVSKLRAQKELLDRYASFTDTDSDSIASLDSLSSSSVDTHASNSIPMAIINLDHLKVTGKFMRVNRAFASFVGTSWEEAHRVTSLGYRKGDYLQLFYPDVNMSIPWEDLCEEISSSLTPTHSIRSFDLLLPNGEERSVIITMWKEDDDGAFTFIVEKADA